MRTPVESRTRTPHRRTFASFQNYKTAFLASTARNKRLGRLGGGNLIEVGIRPPRVTRLCQEGAAVRNQFPDRSRRWK